MTVGANTLRVVLRPPAPVDGGERRREPPLSHPPIRNTEKLRHADRHSPWLSPCPTPPSPHPGKTETTKKAMQYFATLAGGTGVEDQVLEVSHVLV